VKHKQLDLGIQTLPGNYILLLMTKRSRLRVKGGGVSVSSSVCMNLTRGVKESQKIDSGGCPGGSLSRQRRHGT